MHNDNIATINRETREPCETFLFNSFLLLFFSANCENIFVPLWAQTFVTMVTSKKKKWLWAVLLMTAAAIVVAWWMLRPSNKIPEVSIGKLERFVGFESKFVSPRTVSVWLPLGYAPGDSCDVIYMHDGQMLFDANATWNGQEWQIDEIVGQLVGDSTIRRCIVVGIDNTDDRLAEYFPNNSMLFLPAEIRDKAQSDKLQGNEYLQFIVEEVKPFIERRYRPLTGREHTFMMGSSMGGLISLYALCEYPQVFGGVACLSSHLSFSHLGFGIESEQWAEAFRDYVAAHLPEVNSSLVYMDHGTEDFDAEYAPYQKRIDSVFLASGWDKQHYMSRVFEGHEHKEIFWAKRLEYPLLFLLGR